MTEEGSKEGAHHGHPVSHEAHASKEKVIEINLGFFKKNWVFFAVVSVFLLSFYVRTFAFHYNYLLNVDSYYYFRYIKMIVDTGSIPVIDTYMLAPEGMLPGITSMFYEYAGAYLFIAAKFFMGGLELWRFLIYLPAFFASLMAIPAFYIGKLIYDDKAGILMAFLTVFNPAIFMRSIGGDPDSDAIVMLVTLFSMATFLFAYKAVVGNENKAISKKAIIFSALSGVALFIFSITWIGYWYMFYLITGIVFSTLAIEAFFSGHLSNHKNLISFAKPLLVSYAIMMVIFFALSSIIYGPGFFVGTLKQPIDAVQLKVEAENYPNVYVSVQEMMTGGTVKEVVQRAGTISFFMTFVLCIPYLVISYIKKRKHMDTAILILLWSVGAFIATMVAVRFSILLAIPISLGTSIVLAKAWRMALGEDKDIFE